MQEHLNNLREREIVMGDFARLGELTGGRTYDPATIDLDVMKKILGSIVVETTTQDAVGFTVDAAPNPKKHKLEVRLADPHKGTVRGGKVSVSY